MRETVDAPIDASADAPALSESSAVPAGAGSDRLDCATVVVLDFGRTGTDVTVVGVDEDRVVDEARWTAPSGDASDLIVLDHLRAQGILGPREGDHESPEILTFCRSVKESLSTATAARTPASGPDGPVTLITRADFEAALRPTVEDLLDGVDALVRGAGREPEAVVLTGGGATVPLIRALVEDRLGPILPEASEAVGSSEALRASGESGDSGALELVGGSAPDETVEKTEPAPHEPAPHEPEPEPTSAAYSAVERVEPVAPGDRVSPDDASWDLLDEPAPAPERRRLLTVALVLALIVVAVGAAAWAYLGTAAPADGSDGTAPAPPSLSESAAPSGSTAATTGAPDDEDAEDADGDGYPDSWGDAIVPRTDTLN
ncbi:Hsp70 family protein [Rhodococcoides corynebacterioides]|uniref:Hsp70 family protein n=2 Tax=Rhodococcoides corynebacterioides TaxID=53972 RepID=A0ABS7P6Q7_9NOCA|nr:Hsp70 family protein [Rhodococcus corynebacterioides]MBY6368100.1 Hsp70 family protein [Rhodococcus corynebacterioides]